MRRLSFLAVVLVAAVVASTATASELIDRNAAGVKLAVNAKGEALVTYRAEGKLKHVLVSGAVNAIAPTRARKQVEFKLDYAGGWGQYHRDYWKTFGAKCGAYDGPTLAWKVTACTAPDGSHWALQAWQRMLPNYGLAPNATSGVWELRLSHWAGDLPVLTISTDWAWHQWDHLYGTFTYGDSPVFGFAIVLTVPEASESWRVKTGNGDHRNRHQPQLLFAKIFNHHCMPCLCRALPSMVRLRMNEIGVVMTSASASARRGPRPNHSAKM